MALHHNSIYYCIRVRAYSGLLLFRSYILLLCVRFWRWFHIWNATITLSISFSLPPLISLYLYLPSSFTFHRSADITQKTMRVMNENAWKLLWKWTFDWETMMITTVWVASLLWFVWIERNKHKLRIVYAERSQSNFRQKKIIKSSFVIW